MSTAPVNTRILELFGVPTDRSSESWGAIAAGQACPFLGRKCLKVRKSRPDISIGTCVVAYGADRTPVVICPFRLLERHQVFVDCLHLLTKHEPGNALHIVPEVPLPGGSVDYFLVSLRGDKVADFVGIELQTLDTTGTVWPERQRLLQGLGLKVRRRDVQSSKPFGMNWKMTAKTTLVQLHHKIETLEHLNSHLVLVLQDVLLAYMTREFSFEHMSEPPLLGDAMHFHAYSLAPSKTARSLKLAARRSTDANGISTALGLQTSAKVEYEALVAILQSKLSDETLFDFDAKLSVPPSLPAELAEP
jgi:hypothetical protein